MNNWNTSTASAPVDDPLQIAIDAIDGDTDALHKCACRVINAGGFDDLLWDQVKDSALGAEAQRFVQAVRTEVTERANENIYGAREAARESREGR